MLNPEIKRHRDFSNWFLKMFAIEAIVLGQENWETLSHDAKDENVMPILGGLTHKDYVDGPVLWSALRDEEIMLRIVVMREGFSGGIKGVRNIISNLVAPTLALSREGASLGEIRDIQKAGGNESAVGLFLSGNRKLTSPLKGGATVLMRENDVLYPFVNLADHSPVFPSGSSFSQNVQELLNRTIFKREASREFLYLIKPLTRANLELLAEGKKSKLGREEILLKLELIRAYGVLKLFIELINLDVAGINPLLQNSDNLPLLVQSQQLLMTEPTRVNWMVKNGFFMLEDLTMMTNLTFEYEK